MNKKLQVFVSSTYTDLIEERQAAVEAILDAGHIPAGMELFHAGNDSQLQTIYKWIDESDVYMLILGGRYGSIEPKSGKSYTQLEYEYALSKNIPVFAVVLSQSYLTNKINTLGLNNVIEQSAPEKYQSFKSLVMSKIVRIANDCKDISLCAITTLYSFLDSYAFTGWVKSDTNQYSIPNNTESIYKPRIKKENTSNSANQKTSVFIIMPFTEEWSDDLYEVVKDTCISCNIKLTRADEILGSQFIYNDIIKCIKESDIIIADVSVRNANVFYELGFAHALEKNVILIHQPNSPLPFDIAHIRYIEYQLGYSKIKEFQKKLIDTINLYKS